MATNNTGMTQPTADQPRVDTASLKRNEASPNLTLRQTGYKTSYGRSQSDSTVNNTGECDEYEAKKRS
jgi:hypothetical protein